LKSLKIRQNLFGENDGDVANLFSNFGCLYQDLGNLQKAEEFYLKSLQIRKNVFGENYSDVENSLKNFGSQNIGNLQTEEFLLKSLNSF